MTDLQKQFVIQQHTTPDGVHWDLMLEMDDTLWTWRLNTPPAEIGTAPVGAERIHDHPKRFLTYEGPVQNNTAHVKIADKGIYTLCKQTKTSLECDFEGQTLAGTFKLLRKDEENLWELKKI